MSLNTELRNFIRSARQKGLKVGFVPTMGALHQGHLSLIEEAKKKSDLVICSIFINPKQFNVASDLNNYPRTMDEDLKMLASVECDVAFTPSTGEVYQKEVPFEFDFNGLDTPMEGANRPGHFKGVVQVVKRLFEIVEPDIACFGLKDFQQYSIIKQLVRYYGLPIEIIGCPIIREENGLAMSSRNVRLSDKEASDALALSKSLRMIKKNYLQLSLKESKIMAIETVKQYAELEYLEIAEPTSLKTANNWADANHLRAFIAAKVGPVRLIDNLEIF
ncbi:MAG: pantoate--beta-alanine ligase [Flavobacteriales bacterium]|nr:pantoate--beta-alanine ligase [Flavobacteriales bacterium]